MKSPSAAGTRISRQSVSQPNVISRNLFLNMAITCIHTKTSIPCGPLVHLCVCLGLLIALPAGANPIIIDDDSAQIPTIDGSISEAEYAGLSLGVGATNGLVGDGSVLGIDASLSDVAFGLETAGATFTNEVVVLYLDTPIENNSPTSPLVASGGPHNSAVADINLGITFAPGFHGDYAIAMDGSTANLYVITGTSASFVQSYSVTAGSAYEWKIPMADLGLLPGDTIRWIATAVATAPTLVRLSEYHGVAEPPQETAGLISLNDGDFSRFTAPRTLIEVTTTDDEFNSDGDCSLAEALHAAGGQSGDSCGTPVGAVTIQLSDSAYVMTDAPDIADADIRIEGGGATMTWLSGIASGGAASLDFRDMRLTLETSLGQFTALSLHKTDVKAVSVTDDSIVNAGTITVDSSTVECGTTLSQCLVFSDTATVNNSTLLFAGAGPALFSTSGALSLVHSTILANGTVFSVAEATFASSIISGSNCTSPSVQSMGQNVVAASSGCAAGTGDLQVTDVELETLGENGGPTRTAKPMGTSGAIDLAVNCGSVTDQRGEPRPGGLACDAGAFEVQVPLDVAVKWTNPSNPITATEVFDAALEVTSNTLAKAVVVSVALPVGVAPASLPEECMEDATGQLQCTLTDLVGTTVLVFELLTEPTIPETIVLLAALQGSDINAANDLDSIGVTVNPVFGLELVALQPSVEPGEPVVVLVKTSGTCNGTFSATLSFSPAIDFDIVPGGCVVVSNSVLQCSNGTPGQSAVIRGIPNAVSGEFVTVTSEAECAIGSQIPQPALLDIPIQEDPCTTNLKLTSDGQGFIASNTLFQHVFTGGDGALKTGGSSSIPSGEQSGTITRSYAVPNVAAGGTSPRLEVVFRLTGDPNPLFDRFSVCVNDTECQPQSTMEVYATGRNTVPGSAPFIQASNDDYNDGAFDHVFINLSSFVGQNISVTMAFHTVAESDGSSDGVAITQVRLGSDSDGDGAYEGVDAVCDPCWDGDQDGYVHISSPGLATTCPNVGIPDCDDTSPTTNPAALEQCGIPGDEDCDSLFDASDPDCGEEDCAD
ncbi:MAG: choice-of-anchor Q domain-containing protein, partial [Myxococcota bacterium]|nr:choice-of-anchor Q domain-containing protein [Myxococcota bacterium]